MFQFLKGKNLVILGLIILMGVAVGGQSLYALGTNLIENYQGIIKYNQGYYSDLPIQTTDTLSAVGITNTGSETIGGTLEVDGATTLGLANYFRVSSSTSATDTLTASQSGQITFIATTGATTTLPAVSNTGAHFIFSVQTAFTTDAVITSDEGDNIKGSLFVNDAIVACSGEDSIMFIADGEQIGDFVEIISDGTNWNILNSRGETASKITCVDPS